MAKDLDEIIIFANSFPSREFPAKSPFNLNLAKQLSDHAKVKVVVFRTVSLSRIRPQTYIYDGIEVRQIYLPIVPYGTPSIPLSSSTLLQAISVAISAFLIGFYKFDFRNCIVHSVSAGITCIFGDIVSRRTGSKHFIQFIGSDINVQLPVFKRLPSFRKAISNAVGIIGNSLSLVSVFNESGLHHRNIQVIYRGADTNKFTFDESKNNFDIKSEYVFLYLGGLVRSNEHPDGNKKGGVTLLTAWLDNEEYFVKHRSRLYFGGPMDSIESLAGILKKLKYPKAITFIGEIAPTVVPGYIHDASIMIIPSLHEGLPNTAMEAMCAGKAVIASNVGGIPEIIENNVTGLLVTPGSSYELASAMKLLLKNPALVRKLMINSANYARVNLDGRSYAKKVLEFYSSSIE